MKHSSKVTFHNITFSIKAKVMVLTSFQIQTLLQILINKTMSSKTYSFKTLHSSQGQSWPIATLTFFAYSKTY